MSTLVGVTEPFQVMLTEALLSSTHYLTEGTFLVIHYYRGLPCLLILHHSEWLLILPSPSHLSVIVHPYSDPASHYGCRAQLRGQF